MTLDQPKPDRWDIDLSVVDHQTGARRAVNTSLAEGGECLAAELLDAAESVVSLVGESEHFAVHARERYGPRSANVRDLLRLVGDTVADTAHTEELKRIGTLLDEAGYRDPGLPMHRRVKGLLDFLKGTIETLDATNPRWKRGDTAVWRGRAVGVLAPDAVGIVDHGVNLYVSASELSPVTDEDTSYTTSLAEHLTEAAAEPPRSLVEPEQGDDPADGRPETLDGRTLHTVDLPPDDVGGKS